MQALTLEATINKGVDARAAANFRLSNPLLVLKDVPEPQIQEGNDLIVKVSVNGICGSDTHVSECGLDGYVKFSGPANAPVVLGHEFVGQVVDRGSNVTRFRIGDFVAAESIQSCQNCRWCRMGHHNQCENVQLIGLTINGGLSKYIRVKEFHCYNVAPILSRFGMADGIDLAALLEPLGCAFNGLFIDRRGSRVNDIAPGDIAAVFGVGPIGLGAVALLRAAGVGQIIAFDINDKRVELAKKLGATAGFNLSKIGNLRDFLISYTGGNFLNLAIEATGDHRLFEKIIKVMAPRSRLVYLGRTPANVTFDPNEIVTNAITINGSRGHAGYGIFECLIQMIAEDSLKLDGFITAHYDFADVLTAFERARAQQDGKILIHVSNRG